MEIFGIDVAKWNGKIDWNKVKQQKSFAILKVTQKNNHVEESFERNYAGATNAGLPVGVYRYVYAKNIPEAKAEATAITKACLGKNIPYGVWLDLEDKSIKNVGKTNLTSIIIEEANILCAAGFKVGIYCNKDWYDNILETDLLKKEFPFWIARYPLADHGKYNAGSKLNPRDYAVAWQYSSKGKVNGIAGNVDLDVLFDDISGEFNPGKEMEHPVIKRGSVGEEVAIMQRKLIEKGFNVGKKGADGKFGKYTEKALIAFQKANGLDGDGKCGRKTWTVLLK